MTDTQSKDIISAPRNDVYQIDANEHDSFVKIDYASVITWWVNQMAASAIDESTSDLKENLKDLMKQRVPVYLKKYGFPEDAMSFLRVAGVLTSYSLQLTYSGFSLNGQAFDASMIPNYIHNLDIGVEREIRIGRTTMSMQAFMDEACSITVNRVTSTMLRPDVIKMWTSRTIDEVSDIFDICMCNVFNKTYYPVSEKLGLPVVENIDRILSMTVFMSTVENFITLPVAQDCIAWVNGHEDPVPTPVGLEHFAKVLYRTYLGSVGDTEKKITNA